MFCRVQDFFTTPINSRKVGIYKVSRLSSDLSIIKVSSVVKKCVLLPSVDSLIATEFL